MYSPLPHHPSSVIRFFRWIWKFWLAKQVHESFRNMTKLLQKESILETKFRKLLVFSLSLKEACLECRRIDFQRRETRGGDLLCPFFALTLGKKGPDSVYFWVKYSIQNVVLGVPWILRLHNFPCGAFCLVFLTKFLMKCPNSAKPPPPWKISGCAPVPSDDV